MTPTPESIGTGAAARGPAAALAAIAAASMLLAGGANGAIDGDLLHELAFWREVVATRAFPVVDPFAFTPTVSPIVHHEWGFGAVASSAIGLFGATGIVLLKWLLVGALAWLAVREARARVARPRSVAPLLALLAPIVIVLTWSAFATVRAHMATLVGVALLLGILRRDAAGSKRALLWWLPLQVVWQNLHGGFVAGLALIGVCAAERLVRGHRWRRLVALLAVSVGAIVVNPWGVDYYPYLVHALTMPRPLITEWHSVFSEFSFALVLYVAALVPLAIAIRQNGVRRCDGLALVVFTALEAARHQRFLPLFALVLFIHLPAWLEDTPFGRTVTSGFERRRFVIAYVSVIVALPMLAQGLVREFWRVRVPAFTQDRRDHIYPVGAVDHLRDAGFRGSMVTAFGDGSYVMWKLHPAVKVSLDSRYEVAYRDGVIEEHQAFYSADPAALDLPERHHADLVLVPAATALAKHLGELPAFEACYFDDAYAILQRRGGSLPFRDRRGERFEGVFP